MKLSELIEKIEATEGDTLVKSEVLESLKEIASTPAAAGKRRGQLAGLDITEMTDEQLKREKINATSVLYKAKQRGAGEDTIAKNQARVDAVNAELEKRKPATAPVTEGEATEGETVYAEGDQHPVSEEL